MPDGTPVVGDQHLEKLEKFNAGKLATANLSSEAEALAIDVDDYIEKIKGGGARRPTTLPRSPAPRATRSKTTHVLHHHLPLLTRTHYTTCPPRAGRRLICRGSDMPRLY